MRRIALRSVWAHKLRVLLTVVAIVLSVAFITGTLVLGDTIGKVFDDLFAEANEEVDAQVQGVEVFSDDFGGTQRRALPEELAGTVADVDGVDAAEAQVVTVGFGSSNIVLDREGESLGATQGPPTLLENWIADDVLNAYELVGDGRPPAADDEIALNVAAADKGDYELGDAVTVLTQAGAQEYTLVGTFTFGDAESVAGAVSAEFTLAEAQRIAGLDGEVQTVLVRGDEGLGEQDVVDLVAAVLPEGAEVLTGTAAAEQQAESVSAGFEFFQQILLVFGILAVVVGAFIIANTFSILVAQRTRELALLRAVGADRRQVLGSVLLEGAVIGLVAAVVGLGAGVLLATGVIAAFEAAGSDLPTTNLQIGTGPLLWALGVGVGVTLLAALLPAIRATRVPPLAALRDVAVDRSGASRLRLAAAVALLALGALAMSAAWTADGDTDAIPGIASGAVLALAGLVVLGPVVAGRGVRALGAPLPWLRGVTGRVAVENAARSPKRTAATASALLVSVTLVAFITVFAESAKASIEREVDRGFTGDFVVQAPFGFGPPSGFPSSVSQQVAGVDGVASVSAVGFTTAQVGYPDGDTAQQFVTTANPAALVRVLEPRMAVGELTDLTDDGVIVDQTIADKHGIELGDSVTVTGPSGASRALVVEGLSDDTTILGFFTVTRATGAGLFPQQLDVQVFGALEEGADLGRVLAGIEEAVAATPGLDVLDRDAFAGDLADQITSFVTFIYALLGLSVVISVIGVVNTLLLSIHERTRELGLLRAVGMLRPQLRSAVRWEALLIAILGTVVGLAAGLGISRVLVQALEGFGLTAFRVPVGGLAVIVGAAVVLGLVAAAYPAWRASRLDVLDAIATE